MPREVHMLMEHRHTGILQSPCCKVHTGGGAFRTSSYTQRRKPGVTEEFLQVQIWTKKPRRDQLERESGSPFLTPDQPCSSNQPPRRRENLTVFPGETSNSEDPDPDWSRSSETLPGSFRTPATKQFSYSPIWNFLMSQVKAIWFHSAEKRASHLFWVMSPEVVSGKHNGQGNGVWSRPALTESWP